MRNLGYGKVAALKVSEFRSNVTEVLLPSAGVVLLEGAYRPLRERHALDPVLVDLADAARERHSSRSGRSANFRFSATKSEDRTIPKSTIIIEYLARHYPGEVQLLPSDPETALEARLQDRFYDRYVHEPMQKIVTDRLRPPGRNDPHGVELARAEIVSSYDIIEKDMATKRWAAGQTFTLADCAAFPALFYANKVAPLGKSLPEHRSLSRAAARTPVHRAGGCRGPTLFRALPDQT